MKKFCILMCALAGMLFSSCCGGDTDKGWTTVDGVIVFDTPEREPGHTSECKISS